MLRPHLTVLFLMFTIAAGVDARSFRGQMPRLREGARTAPGDYERWITVGGTPRWYELHVPPRATTGRLLPLVFNFHGGGGSPDGARRSSALDAKADREGFLVVYPAGTGVLPRRLLTWNAGGCCAYAMKKNVDDAAFVRAILDELPRFVPLDLDRVYATGFSNGAMLAHRLACELSDRLAAVAPVSGPLALPRCEPEVPVPLMHIHGRDDQNAPYGGGRGARSLTDTDFRSVADTIALWRKANRTVDTARVEKRGAVTVETWDGKPDGAPVVLISIDGQGHVWPGGDALLPARMVGRDAGALHATDEIWTFFSRYARRVRK